MAKLARGMANGLLMVLVSVSLSSCCLFGIGDCRSVCTDTPSAPSCSSSGTAALGSKTLAIAPVAQQTMEWCWLASAQMIFQYYGVRPVNGISYQCGIMGAVLGPASVCFYDCTACVFGSGSDAGSAYVLQQYPSLVQQYFFPFERIPQVAAQLFERPLSMTEVQAEINGNHPVEMGITPSGQFIGQAAHDVVLVGYVVQNTSSPYLIINDPFPYDTVLGPSQNPYRQLGAIVLQPGQYQVLYATAASSLQWSASITTRSF